MNLVDILVVNYRSADSLKKCLESVYRYLSRLPLACYIYNNGRDPGMDGIEAAFPQVHLTVNDKNIGFGAAVNRLIRQGKSPYILLLNPDTYLQNDALEKALNFLKTHQDIGILGPRIIDDDGAVQGSARTFPSFSTGMFGRTSLLTRFFPNNRYSKQNILTLGLHNDRPAEVDWVSGACMLVRRDAAEGVGPIDERFFMYWEDADWCRRMWERGWKVVYYPQACVYHSVGSSSSKRPVRSNVDFHKSAYLLFVKYRQDSSRWVRIAVFSALALRFYFKLLTIGFRR
jgi:GT2 family glycosyltransferase